MRVLRGWLRALVLRGRREGGKDRLGATNTRPPGEYPARLWGGQARCGHPARLLCQAPCGTIPSRSFGTSPVPRKTELTPVGWIRSYQYTF